MTLNYTVANNDILQCNELTWAFLYISFLRAHFSIVGPGHYRDFLEELPDTALDSGEGAAGSS